jgi:hypothetical protein
VTGEEIRNQLELLESQTIELAAALIAAIAEIRVRLVLMESAIEWRRIIEAKDER